MLNKKLNKKFLLIILDGWGIGDNSSANAILAAKTPNLDKLFNHYPHSQLQASGPGVGLPEGVMGNSEVGHLNIGAGRILYEDLTKINLACEDGSLAKNPVLQKAFAYAKKEGRNLHFIGLLSDAGVHSMNTHLYKLCDLAKDNNLKNVYIHALSDGRDTNPKSGIFFVRDLEKYLKGSTGVLATLIGRYYTMDRDKRWERIKQGYDLMVHGEGKPVINMVQGVKESYAAGITDEFIKPLVKVDKMGRPVGLIKANDVVICFNFRSDRLREITIALTQRDFPKLEMKTLPLHYYTMTSYDVSFRRVKIIFGKKNIESTLGEVIAVNGLKQLRVAETEKYAHVTFFFSGGREKEFAREERLLIPSPKIATYDLQPEMSAFLIKEAVTKKLKQQKFDFICLNFANGDMVGHTGVFSAIMKAIASVDTCVGEVVKTARKNNYEVLIIADHGNAELARNKDGSPNTNHSTNPVPCLLISADYKKIKSGVLADIAPTILKIMGLNIPKEMTGKILV